MGLGVFDLLIGEMLRLRLWVEGPLAVFLNLEGSGRC